MRESRGEAQEDLGEGRYKGQVGGHDPFLVDVATRRDGTWRVSTVSGILGNRFYTGRVEFEGELIRAQHDAIVSDLAFRQAAGDDGELG
ncbi:MAG: recombinase family protein [Planctomycetota bacterium]